MHQYNADMSKSASPPASCSAGVSPVGVVNSADSPSESSSTEEATSVALPPPIQQTPGHNQHQLITPHWQDYYDRNFWLGWNGDNKLKSTKTRRVKQQHKMSQNNLALFSNSCHTPLKHGEPEIKRVLLWWLLIAKTFSTRDEDPVKIYQG